MKKYNLDICQFSGYGHYKIGLKYYGKMLTTVTTDMPSIDDYKSNEGEKDGRELRIKKGFLSLKSEILRDNNMHLPAKYR